jgi:hypothetical protein
MTRRRVQQNVPAMTSLLLQIYAGWGGLASKSLQRIFFIIAASFLKKTLRKLDSLGIGIKISAFAQIRIRLSSFESAKNGSRDGRGSWLWLNRIIRQ